MVTPGQIRFLGSYDLGLHPKADPNQPQGWIDKYNLTRILTLIYFTETIKNSYSFLLYFYSLI